MFRVMYDLGQFDSETSHTGIFNYSWHLVDKLAKEKSIEPYFYTTYPVPTMTLSEKITDFIKAENVTLYTPMHNAKLFPPFENTNRKLWQKALNRSWYTLMQQLEAAIGESRFRLHRPDEIDMFHFTRYQISHIDKPKVATLHDMIYAIHPEYFTKQDFKSNRRVMDFYERNVDAFVAVSETTKQDVVRLTNIPEERIVVAYSAIDENYFPEPNGKLAADILHKFDADGCPYFVCLATLEIRKNHLGAIKAFDNFKHDPANADYRLFIVGGSGWKFNKVREELQTLDCAKHIHFTDFLPQPAIRQLLSDATGLIFPSFYEGFGLPPLEAIACGCAVVASRLGALPEVLADSAEYADAHDPEDIARGMYAISSDQAYRAELIRRGKIRVEYFNMNLVAKETLRAYQLALDFSS